MAIWRLLQDLWLLRNTHLHVQSPIELPSVQQRMLHTSVRDLYDLQPSLPAPDQRLFTDDVETFLQHPTPHLQTWLSMTTPAIDAALAELG